MLAEARKEAGMTQAAVAHRLAREQSFVAKIENGERRIDVVEFLDVSDAVGAEPIKIFRRLIRSDK